MKDQLKGYQFKDAAEVQVALTTVARDHTWWLPEIFWRTVWILGEMYSRWRTIFWTQLPLTTSSCHQIKDMADSCPKRLAAPVPHTWLKIFL
jgi:hypothetical protein